MQCLCCVSVYVSIHKDPRLLWLVEDLYPVVVSVTDINMAGCVDCYGMRTLELPCLVSFSSKGLDKVPLAVEYRNTAITILKYVQEVAAVDAHTDWDTECSHSRSSLADFSQQLTTRTEDLDSVVAEVSYIDIPSPVYCYAIGKLKLSWATAFAANRTGEGQVNVQDLDSVVISITHVDLLVGGVESGCKWCFKP